MVAQLKDIADAFLLGGVIVLVVAFVCVSLVSAFVTIRHIWMDRKKDMWGRERY